MHVQILRLRKRVSSKQCLRAARNIISRRNQSHCQIPLGDFRLPGHAHQNVVSDGLHVALPDGKRIIRDHRLGLVGQRGHADQRATRRTDVILAQLRIHRHRANHLHTRTGLQLKRLRIVHGVRDVACRIYGTRAGHG